MPTKYTCLFCQKEFISRDSRVSKNTVKRGRNTYCKKECMLNDKKAKKKRVSCDYCGKDFMKSLHDITKTNHDFCSRSCSATYRNNHKTTGTRRSKLEVWLEKQLTKLYPNLDIHFNHKDAIGSELDIYIPSLNIAFELNGIFHYEPVFGNDKLKQIQNSDQNKFYECQKRGINLCVIDTSGQKYFKEKTSKKFLQVIVGCIGIEPMKPCL